MQYLNKLRINLSNMLGARRIEGKHKSPQFCLISGAPRSGTTAINSWLSRHREVAAFGESRVLVAISRFIEEVDRFEQLERKRSELMRIAQKLIEEYFQNQSSAKGRRLLVNKEPLEPIAFPDKNYARFLANMRILSPDIKLLFVIRDPISTVYSMSQRKWGYSLKDFEPKKLSIEDHIENWCACADAILAYAEDSNSYICQFGRLLGDPINESRRVWQFLGIPKADSFQGRQTRTVGFSREECELILTRCQPFLRALHKHGLTDIQ